MKLRCTNCGHEMSSLKIVFATAKKAYGDFMPLLEKIKEYLPKDMLPETPSIGDVQKAYEKANINESLASKVVATYLNAGSHPMKCPNCGAEKTWKSVD